MRRPTGTRGLLAVLALLSPLILSSSSTGSDPARPGDAVCEAGPDAAAQRAQAKRARLAEHRGVPTGRTDVVLLNGRGYNYGAVQDSGLDAAQLEALKAAVRRSRR